MVLFPGEYSRMDCFAPRRLSETFQKGPTCTCMPGTCCQHILPTIGAQDYVTDTDHAQHLITLSRHSQAMCSI